MDRNYKPFINFFRTDEAAMDYAFHALDTLSPIIYQLRVRRNNTNYHEDEFPYIVVCEVCVDNDFEVLK